MSNEDVKKEKKFVTKSWDDKQKSLVYKPFKSKGEGLEDSFESGTVKHAAQFTKALEDIVNYIKKNVTLT